MKAQDLTDLTRYRDYISVGELLDFICKHNISRESKILIQRVEDIYFEDHGWKTIKKDHLFYNQLLDINNKVKEGYFDNREKFPLLEDPKELYTPEERLEEFKDEYHPAFCAVKHDDDHLYLNLHY